MGSRSAARHHPALNLLCALYGLIVPESLHMSTFLEQILPGFEWLTAGGFVVGLVEAFLYGAYAGSCSRRSTTCY